MIDRRDETKRLVAEINDLLESEMSRLQDYSYGVQFGHYLRELGSLEQVGVLRVIKRICFPLHPAFIPGIVVALVKFLDRQGIDNAGDLITRKSITAWSSLYLAIKEHGESIGSYALVEVEAAQEVLLLAFTETEIAGKVSSVVRERGLLPVDALCGLVAEREESVSALSEGSL